MLPVLRLTTPARSGAVLNVKRSRRRASTLPAVRKSNVVALFRYAYPSSPTFRNARFSTVVPPAGGGGAPGSDEGVRSTPYARSGAAAGSLLAYSIQVVSPLVSTGLLRPNPVRSEEHTSEIQSPDHL